FWRDIASLGGGAYAVIPLAGGVRPISTPFDLRLGEINRDLVRHTVVFGSAASREAQRKKLTLARDLPAEAAADRAGYLARAGGVAGGEGQRREHLAGTASRRERLLEEAADLDRLRHKYIDEKQLRHANRLDSQVLTILRKQATSRWLRF